MSDLPLCSQPVADSIDDIERLRKELIDSKKKLLAYSSPCQPYKDCKEKINTLLLQLSEISITVGDLRITKIGKFLTSYSKKLPADLTKTCENVNEKWKEMLRKYRENFKEKNRVALVSIKEEPLSQVYVEDSCVKGKSKSRKGKEFLPNPSTVSSSSIGLKSSQQALSPYNTQQNILQSISQPFIQDVQQFISQTIQKVNHVETQCFDIKSSMTQMQNKLLHFEKNVNEFMSSIGSSFSSPVSVNDCETKRKSLNVLDFPSVACKTVLAKTSEKQDGLVLVDSDSETDTEDDQQSNEQNVVNNNDEENSPSLFENIFEEIAITADEVRSNENGQLLKKNIEKNNGINTCMVKQKSIKNTSSPPSLEKESEFTNQECNRVIDIAIKKEDLQSEEADMLRSVVNQTLKRKHSTETKLDETSKSISHQIMFKKTSNIISESSPKTLNTSTEMKKKLHNQTPCNSSHVSKTFPSNLRKTSSSQCFIKKSSGSFSKTSNRSTVSTMLIEPQAKKGSVGNPFSRLDNVLTSLRKGISSSNEIDPRRPNTDQDGFVVPKPVTHRATITQSADQSGFIVRGERVEISGEELQNVEMEEFLSYSQAVEEMEMQSEIEQQDSEYLLQNKKKQRTSWNQNCKKREGMKHALLANTNGRLKAVHKSSTGKEVIHDLLKKKHK